MPRPYVIYFMELYLTMPKPGETIREGLVIQWIKKEGESVNEGDPLVELETEKAVFTFDSPFRGTLKKILVPENESRPVATPIALFEVSEEDGSRYLMLGVGVPVSSPSVGAPLVGAQETGGKNKRADTKPAPTPSISHSPLVRNLAKEHHLSPQELDQIKGSGPGGRLTKEDLLAYVGGREVSLQTAGGQARKAPTNEYELIPLPPIRQRIAKHMVKSHHEIPQAASSVDVDMTAILQFKRDKGEAFQKKYGLSLTPFYFFLYAVREALKKFPNFNVGYQEEGGKAFLKKYGSIHLGFAVATTQGLLNPVIHRAENLKFHELAQAASDLEKKVKEGKHLVEDVTGASFALNNPGAYGGVRCYQIIPSPLVAILGMNRIQKRPWVVGDQIVPRDIAVLDLSFDHRVLDGADAIQFVEAVRGMLEGFAFHGIEM